MRDKSEGHQMIRSFSVWFLFIVLFLAAAPAQAQVITLTPTSLNYGNVTVGNSSTMSFTVTNTSAGDITVDGMTVTNLTFPQFDLLTTGTCPSLPFTLIPTNPCTVDIEFVPSVAGGYSGEFEVTAGAESATGTLAGTGRDPVAGTGIPTLSEMGIALLVLLMAVTGVVALRRMW